MRVAGRLVVIGAGLEVGCWMIATVLTSGSWRYNVSALYAQGAPRPVLVMAGEACFAVALASLTLLVGRVLPPGDHRTIGRGLLGIASAGAAAGAFARNSCEESVPRCEGRTFATLADWVHGVGGLAEILGIAGAALVLAALLPRGWSRLSASIGFLMLVAPVVSDAVPSPWVGTAQRLMILVLVGWVAALGAWLASADSELRAQSRTSGVRLRTTTPGAAPRQLG